MLLIAILGGRVIPCFTERGIADAATRRRTSVEYLSFGALIGLMALVLMDAMPVAIVVIGILAAIGHALRLAGWYQNTVWTFLYSGCCIWATPGWWPVSC